MKIIKLFQKLILMILTVFLLTCCQENQQRVDIDGFAQGTYYHIVYYADDTLVSKHEIDSFFVTFDQIASLWNPNSMISKVNNNEIKSVTTPFKRIFRIAQEVFDVTNGALDCTIGNVVSAWGFGAIDSIQPSEKTIDSLMQYVGFQNVALDDNNQIIKLHPETKLDFNAVAKGFSVDMLAQHLHACGIHNFVIDVGGEITVSGQKPTDSLWIIGIEKPALTSDSERNLQIKLKLSNKSIATSGNYRKYYEKNGIRFSHTIDPKSGYPVNHTLLSATVITEKCAVADAFATAFMVMGTEKTIEFLQKHAQLQVYLIYAHEDGLLHVWQTEGFKNMVINDI